MTDPDVAILQTFLTQKGLLPAGNTSGYFGALTQTALKQYQCNTSIVCTGTETTTGYGMVGGATRTRINIERGAVVTSTTPTATTTVNTATKGVVLTKSLYRGSKHAQVTLLQQFLVSKGLLTSDSITGFFGPKTETALKSFQCSTKIVCAGTPSSTGYGVTGPKTRSAIGK